MHANFAAALAATLKHEGGWADHPKDPGGATMKGVTLATFRKHFGVERTADDLRAITDEQLRAIYRAGYWDVVQGDRLPAGVGLAVFDYGVNSGPATAVKALQRVVGAEPDGIVGPKTLAAIDAMGAPDTIRRLTSQRLMFLQGLPTWPVFGKGWARRVHAIELEALRMVDAAEALPEPAPEVEPSLPSVPVGVGVGLTGVALLLGQLAPWIAISVAVFGAIAIGVWWHRRKNL